MREFVINLVLSVITLALLLAPFVGCYYASNDFVVTFMGGFLGVILECIVCLGIFSIVYRD